MVEVMVQKILRIVSLSDPFVISVRFCFIYSRLSVHPYFSLLFPFLCTYIVVCERRFRFDVTSLVLREPEVLVEGSFVSNILIYIRFLCLILYNKNMVDSYYSTFDLLNRKFNPFLTHLMIMLNIMNTPLVLLVFFFFKQTCVSTLQSYYSQLLFQVLRMALESQPLN